MALNPQQPPPIELSWLRVLKLHVENAPFVILRFDNEEWETLHGSRRGVNEFTIARSHTLLKGVRPQTPCLLQGKSSDKEQLYFGLISSRSTVTTLESRLKVRCAVQIKPDSKSGLLRLISDKANLTNLKERLHGDSSVITLSPKLSSSLIEKLASIDSNRGAMRAVAELLSAPKTFRGLESLQDDALRVALRIFGLEPNDPALLLELVEGRDTALARFGIMEDSVIEHDARYIPGYDLVQSDLTGRAIFKSKKGNEQLEIFTANKRPLEHCFGVDLIYLNVSRQNIVMLQYKMLEPLRKDVENTDWIYRPDTKLDAEIRRMNAFAAHCQPGPHEYRLNPSVFYLKFVKRDGSIGNGGIITPLEHFQILRVDPACRGSKGGLRVSFDSLSGRYLRQCAFLDLVRSGYIGAHAETTEHMKVLIDAVLKNDKAVIAAIQRPLVED